jgi:hypothetical protein
VAYLGPGAEDRDVGSLWFVAALLSFSLAYAAWRWARPAGNHSGTVMRPRQLPIAAAVIAAGSFAVWLWWSWDGATLLDLRWQE